MSTTLDELVEDFEFLGDWEERYRYIIELGRKLPHMEESDKNEQTIVEGCISQVWMITNLKEESEPAVMEIIADSDAHIVKGLIAIILKLYSGRPPQEILTVDIDEVFTKLGLDEHLSPNRRNGFQSMLQRIKVEAQRYL